MDLWQLSDLATPWCVHVASTLRVAHHLRDGKTGIHDLAAATGADPESLTRVLRHLIGKGLFAEPAPNQFALNDAALDLLDEKFLLAFDLDGFGGRMAQAWSTLLAAVRTGKPAYHELFGRPYWEDLEAHPDIAASFDAMMGPGHGTPDPDVLLDPADWAGIRTVVDVGGGTGSLLTAILKAHPHCNGTLVDLPRTVANAIFEQAGVAGRAAVAPQSFFDPLPAGADLYLLERVLVDWPDPEAQAILSRCAEAAHPNGRVVVVSGITPNPTPDPELLMLLLVGGKERTLEEFTELALRAGLRVRAAGHRPSGGFLVECISARDGAK